MGSRNHLRTWHLLGLILVSSQLQIPLEERATYEPLEKDIAALFDVMDALNHRLYFFITFTGAFDLRPSLEQRLMEHFSVPIYTVGTTKGRLNCPRNIAESMVITLFSGPDDLAALNNTELSNGSQFFGFVYIPPRNGSQLLTTDEIRQFFTWCWERRFLRSLLFFRGETEFETWTYFYFTNITTVRIREQPSFKSEIRRNGLRISVQVTDDPPASYWYNSTEQADVTSGGNISLTGSTGILMVEFMRYINASMDITPTKKVEVWDKGILEATGDRRVDMVANLVDNDSYVYSPVVMNSQICLVLPRRRLIPFNRYLDTVIISPLSFINIAVAVCVFGVKYLAYRRRGIGDTLFSTFRFLMGIPLPGGQLNRMPLADKIVEVYSFLFMAILIGICGSILCTALTTGIHYPPITDVESFRASGLRILTDDFSVQQAFEDNRMPSELADLLDLMDDKTLVQKFTNLDESNAYVARTLNWYGYQMYQKPLKDKPFGISGSELCSEVRPLRLPISPYSPLRYIYAVYFHRIFESGLLHKWMEMGYQKFRELHGVFRLPVDKSNEWKPLNLDFFSVFIKIYIGGMLLSIVIFIMELVCKRYGNR